MKRVACLGNIWEYARRLAPLGSVKLVGIVYDDPQDLDVAIRVGRELGVEVLRVSDDAEVRQALGRIASQAGPIDIGIMANFGIILSEETLGLAKKGFVNFHPGVLPAQAGREPVRRVWEAGESASGLTIHRATAKPDAGPVLFSYPYTLDRARSLDENILVIYRLGLPCLEQVIFPS